jgi:hypothetical protein
MNLYDLTQEAKALEDLILEACNPETGELPENAAELIEQWSSGIEGQLEKKLEAIGRLVRNWDADAVAFKAEAERLADKRRAAENRAKSLKAYAKLCLDSLGSTKQVAGVFTFAVQKNGGKVPLELAADLDPKALPVEYQKVEVSPDSEAIRTALEAGQALDFAKFGVVGTHLRIR